MAEFLTATAVFIFLTVGVGLCRVLRGPGIVDRIASMQLIGSGGTAVLVLLSAIGPTPALVDVAIVLALLATFASAAATLKIAASSVTEPTDASKS